MTRQPRPIIEKLAEKWPGWDYIDAAVQELSNEHEIIQFYSELIDFYRANGSENDKADPVRAANEGVGYGVWNADARTRQVWLGTLQDVYHPVFGRHTDIDFNTMLHAGEKVYEGGIEAGREYVNKSVRDLKPKKIE